MNADDNRAQKAAAWLLASLVLVVVFGGFGLLWIRDLIGRAQ